MQNVPFCFPKNTKGLKSLGCMCFQLRVLAFQLLNQVTAFHETWCEHYVNEADLNARHLSLL